MVKVIVATRRSELALAQCRQFLQTLTALDPEVETEELHVVTTGDKVVDRPLASIGGKGLFLKEIEEELLAGRADIAVHSMKDVPPEIHPDLMIGCVPAREDPRDSIITTNGESLSELKEGAVLGTSSLRRGVQLTRTRPDLRIVPIRGNVGTRIRKCREGLVDVTVLARAGLNRLNLQKEATATLEPEECLPAVGQGALAIELRKQDVELAHLLGGLQDAETAITSAAERGVMTAVEGDCKTPVASYAVREGDDIWLRALLAEPDGSHLREDQIRASWPLSEQDAAALGYRVGQRLRQAK